jgi:hypothetical protein
LPTNDPLSSNYTSRVWGEAHQPVVEPLRVAAGPAGEAGDGVLAHPAKAESPLGVDIVSAGPDAVDLGSVFKDRRVSPRAGAPRRRYGPRQP